MVSSLQYHLINGSKCSSFAIFIIVSPEISIEINPDVVHHSFSRNLEISIGSSWFLQTWRIPHGARSLGKTPWGIDESVEVTMAGYTDFEAGKADTGGDHLGEK